MTVLSRLGDIMIVSLCFLLTSIPVVTIGAAASAAHRDMMKIVKESQTYTLKGYFSAFRENFKKGTLLWLILLAAGLVLAADIYILSAVITPSALTRGIIYVFILLALVYVMTLLYTFPLTATFENSVRNTLKNALLMSIRHLPWTLLLILVWAAPVLLCLILTNVWYYILPFMIFFGFGCQFFISAYIFNHIFSKYMPAEPEPDTEKETELKDEEQAEK